MYVLKMVLHHTCQRKLVANAEMSSAVLMGLCRRRGSHASARMPSVEIASRAVYLSKGDLNVRSVTSLVHGLSFSTASA